MNKMKEMAGAQQNRAHFEPIKIQGEKKNRSANFFRSLTFRD